jgi:hypothetical protein
MKTYSLKTSSAVGDRDCRNWKFWANDKPISQTEYNAIRKLALEKGELKGFSNAKVNGMEIFYSIAKIPD